MNISDGGVGAIFFSNRHFINNYDTDRLIWIYFQGGQMILVAKRGIKKGEEITNNYGIHHNNMPLSFR